jgi:hypothetical protein
MILFISSVRLHRGAARLPPSAKLDLQLHHHTSFFNPIPTISIAGIKKTKPFSKPDVY